MELQFLVVYLARDAALRSDANHLSKISAVRVLHVTKAFSEDPCQIFKFPLQDESCQCSQMMVVLLFTGAYCV